MTKSNDGAPVVAPLSNIPFPTVDLARIANPNPSIYNSAEFAACRKYFADSPSAERSLLTATAQALLYTVIRNLHPDHVVEIGTYRAGTSEGLARALHANGNGILHTLSPFDADRVASIMPHWPPELGQHVRYHQMDSMAFFMLLDAEAIRPDLVLIDGNHEYEFANFDIQASARRLNAGGFMFVDNVSQAGPYFATRDFLGSHPDWIDCSVEDKSPSDTLAFSYDRSNIPVTDFFVLRTPAFYPVGARPMTLGEVPWSGRAVSGVRLSLKNRSGPGTLHVQCILRAFSETRNVEMIGEGSAIIEECLGEIDVGLQNRLVTDGGFDLYKVEVWLVWHGPGCLALQDPPRPY